ncbi:MAG: cyclase [Prosthecochloris sp.]|nr:cyclase [Prosthecochloris sp.]
MIQIKGMFRALLFALLLLMSHTPAATGENTQDDPALTRQRLLEGETVIDLHRNTDDIIDVSGSIYVHSKPATIWNIITDYNNLAHTMPRVRESRVVEDKGNIKIIDQTSKTGVLFIKIKFSTRMTITENFPETLSFELISGDFKTFNGKWVLTPDKSRNGTFLVWSAQVNPDFSAPDFIVDAVQKRDLRELLETIRELSESETATSISEDGSDQHG